MNLNERAVTLDRAITESLGSDIAAGRRKPGDLMRLEDLAAEFGVSRTVVRDAVRELSSLGLIESRRRIGIEVLDPSSWSVFDPRVIRWRVASERPQAQLRSLTELRLAVEPVAALFAATRRSASQADRLLVLADHLDTSGRNDDRESYARSDVEFHATILQASDNEMFAALIESVGAALSARTESGLMPAAPALRSFELHRTVAHSIDRRDGFAARDAMQRIIEDVMNEVTPVG